MLNIPEREQDLYYLRPFWGSIKHTAMPKKELPEYCQNLYAESPFSVTLEGQVVAACDEIAQMTHDLDDYLRCNILEYPVLINYELIEKVNVFYSKEYSFNLEKKLQDIDDKNKRKDLIIRCLVDYLITSLITHSVARIDGELRALSLKKVYISFRSEEH